MANGSFSDDTCWYYDDVWAGFEPIRGYYAFNAARVDTCWVGGEKVVPQPGDYYGGWITSDVAGPFKGAKGTEWW